MTPVAVVLVVAFVVLMFVAVSAVLQALERRYPSLSRWLDEHWSTGDDW